ncbi:hypothetical protein [Acinetobacter baumannii]|uniref:hypothetical protein n=1 Tax=Acinetobacter baumannii TaxID=470 RepID=UPI001AE6BC15|nr:hypothetical protein [Acinetobacter baumannii]
MSKTGLVIRVNHAKGVESILLDTFRFTEAQGPLLKAQDFNPRRFLRCIYCHFDEFNELATNFLECSQCESKVEISPRAEGASHE